MSAGARNKFRVFAYGSNMLSARLRERCPSAQALGVAQLPGHELWWHKRSTDGSGKCDVVSADSDHAVLGVVYKIHTGEKAALDRAEGLHHGYDQKDAAVILNGDVVTVCIYVATDTDSTLQPYTWYKALVVAGAKEHLLPAPYIVSLESVKASEDPDRTRHDRNMLMVSAANHMVRDQA